MDVIYVRIDNVGSEHGRNRFSGGCFPHISANRATHGEEPPIAAVGEAMRSFASGQSQQKGACAKVPNSHKKVVARCCHSLSARIEDDVSNALRRFPTPYVNLGLNIPQENGPTILRTRGQGTFTTRGQVFAIRTDRNFRQWPQVPHRFTHGFECV